MLLEALKALLFGIVEGITEWLPISSTGHMMLLNQFVELDVSAEFYDTFLVVIQLGAILAVILLFFHKLNPFSGRKTKEQKRTTWNIWGKVVIGSIPAAIIGILFDDWMEDHVMNDPSIAYIVVAAALIAYGIIFIIIEVVNKRRLQDALRPRGRHAAQSVAGNDDAPRQHGAKPGRALNMPGKPAADNSLMADYENDPSNAISSVTNFDELSYVKAFIIGIFQSLAVVPGTSRSGSIIIGSMLLGCSRTVATEFAFFLAIPIMFGWSLIKFLRHGFAYTSSEWIILAIGVVVAFLVSIVSIKFLVGFIKKHDFKAFGVYRIIIGALVFLYFGQFVNHLFF